MSQFWADIAFLHWRVEADVLLPFMPPGARPDLYDGSAWVGLLPFRMERAAIGAGPAVPYLGTFWETNVRLYSTDDRGRPGVVFLSLEAERLAVVLGARTVFNVPYFWAQMSGCVDGVVGQRTHRYRSQRRVPPGHTATRSLIEVTVGEPLASPGPLEIFLSARFGLHTSLAGRGVWVPNTHRPWPLRTARVANLKDELVAATGLPDLPAERPPDHVMFSSGVHTHFGMPTLHRRAAARPGFG
ncbi:MAG: DUF2071 domain-containing protein [Ornithinimicrobium sp.]